MRSVAIGLIKLYQWCIAPLLGNVCKYTPTCSQYAVEALQRHGFLRGSWLAAKRIVRCNPWHDGCGRDDVPKEF